MQQSGFKVYGYRWVVLLVFMAVIAINQLLWITFAAITTDATQFYGVSDLSIGLLSLIFMIVYIFVSFPASWMIDTYGIRVGVGIGAALTGTFGLVRGLMADNYTWVLAAQIGIAIGQPFILNAITTIAARWFPAGERATASGIGSLAMYLGILLGLALTPYPAIWHFRHVDDLRGCRHGYHAHIPAVWQGTPTHTALSARPGVPFAGSGWFEQNDPSARFHLSYDHLFRRAGRVQRGHHLDRADSVTPSLHSHTGWECGRHDDLWRDPWCRGHSPAFGQIP